MLIICFIIILSMLLFKFWIYFQNKTLVKELKDLPALTYALVLGAGLESDGKPTDILSDRVLSAVRLIETGKVGKLVMSGSSKKDGYDEAAAMENLAIQAGVEQEKILQDTQGISTLDSLINFSNRFQNENLVVVTQNFHLPRSLWLAGQLGLNCFGHPANIFKFSQTKKIFWSVREFISLPFNLLKLFLFNFRKKIGRYN